MNKLIGFIFIFSVLTGCNSSTCISKIVSREVSPDNRVDAVIAKVNCGATTDYSFRVHIVPAGSEPLGNHVFLADHIKGLEVNWIENQKLAITYDEARIFEYTNFWHSKELDNFEYFVSITEAIRDQL